MTTTHKENLSVLIVDDEVLIRNAMAFDLDLVGYRCLEAGSGHEALRVLQDNQGQVSAIISDIRMPEGDGIELLTKVKAMGLDVPFIFMSGYTELPLWEAYAKGADAYFAKPFDMDQMLGAIRSLWLKPGQRWANNAMALQPKRTLSLVASERELLKLCAFGRGGMFIACDSLNFTRDELVSLDMTLPGMRLRGTAIVRWARYKAEGDLEPGLGLEFISLDDGCRTQIIEHLGLHPMDAFIPQSLLSQVDSAVVMTASERRL